MFSSKKYVKKERTLVSVSESTASATKLSNLFVESHIFVLIAIKAQRTLYTKTIDITKLLIIPSR